MPVQGPNEKAVRATLKRLEVNAATDALGQAAVTLGRTLDNDAGMATAAVARELRALLTELEGRTGGNDDELSRLLADLSAPVVNTSN